eukprot:1159502-Pelagomonas_calceolata.AAC.1
MDLHPCEQVHKLCLATWVNDAMYLLLARSTRPTKKGSSPVRAVRVHQLCLAAGANNHGAFVPERPYKRAAADLCMQNVVQNSYQYYSWAFVIAFGACTHVPQPTCMQAFAKVQSLEH